MPIPSPTPPPTPPPGQVPARAPTPPAGEVGKEGAGRSAAARSGAGGWWLDPALFAGIAAVAFAVRFVYMLQARACPLFDVLIMDGRQYYNWATGIVGGDWVGTQVFYQAPLYPYFLAVVRLAVGDDLWSIRLVQIALGAVSCGLLFLAGRSLFSRSAGVLAGVMLALYPPAIFFDTLIQKAGLGLLWMTLLLWLIAVAGRRPSIVASGLLGGTLALLMLTREETILLAPVLLGWVVVRTGRSGGAAGRAGVLGAVRPAAPFAAAFVGAMAIVLMPVAVRNYSVGGEFILTTSQAGPNFYIGNNPKADGVYAPLRPGRSNTPYERQDAVELAELALGRTLTTGEVSKYWFGRSLEFIRNEPGTWLKLMGRKALLLVNAYEVPDYEDQYFFERFSALLRGLSGVWHFGVLAPMAAAGMALTLGRRRDKPQLLVLFAVAATLCIAVVLFFIFGRYRFPLAPVLMLFAAGGVSQLAAMAREGGFRGVGMMRLGGAGIVLVGVGVLANWPIFERDHQLAIAYSNAGAALADTGDDERALELYEEALRIDRNLPDTLSNVAIIVGRPRPGAAGDMARAIALLREAAAQRPNDARIEYRLGTALAETGDLPGAAVHLAKAVELGPSDIDARTNYAMVLLHLGQTAAGAEQLGGIVRQQPENLMAASFLAWILATTADPDLVDAARAVRLGERLVEATARMNPEMLDILGAAQARAGQYGAAVETASAAVALAERMGEHGLAAEIRQRMSFYRRQQPWIER